ncbi:MAG: glycoside hydrolase family 95 protein [Ruminococcaceae bacterium]|nr:glycoside hydrolase family 95 protein [Oscillospiraceae bacterium]
MKNYELWYTSEAPFGLENRALYICGDDVPDDGWEKWSLPLGNGYMGINVFGRTHTERLQITENSLSNPAVWDFADRCNAGLNNFCELYLDFGHDFSHVTDYRRSLSLNTAIARTEYTLDGIRYKREHFASYPDRVFVTSITADRAGALSFTVRPEIPFLGDFLLREGDGMGKSGEVHAKGNRITLTGRMHYYNILFEGQVTVLPKGGRLITNATTISVENADEVMILVAVGTNYRLESRVFLEKDPKKKLSPYPHPHDKVSAISDSALRSSYGELKVRHIKDYAALFERTHVDLGAAPAVQPTDRLLEKYKAGKRDPYLEELYFSYGRYLLIASSRKGSYPANLQGTWNQYASSPWTAGYWHNINVQMNYWPAFNTNLTELFIPYIDYFNAYRPLAEELANEYVKEYIPEKYSPLTGENGMTVGTGAWLYKIDGIPAPGEGHSGPGTGAFTAKLFTDYCAFSMDRECLESVAYIANLRMAKFLSKTLEAQKDGTLLVKHSASPEQKHRGKYYHTSGCAFDQQMVYECYRDTVAIADELGIMDDFIEQIREELPRLDPVSVGASGQVKEYREEVCYGDIGEHHHRHISHLVGLYPGTLINQTTPEWLEAAKVSLNLRGDRSTGWSTAHKINAWARAKDGNRAYDLVRMILCECTLPNLWDSHPPFQIDGNLGAAAGIAEMLLQSHEGFVHLLPALPDEWKNGAFEGLTARGGFVVGAEWSDGTLTRLSVTSRVGGTLKLFLGTKYASEESPDGFLQRKMLPGETFRLTF